MRVARTNTADWREAAGKETLTESALLQLINARLKTPSLHHGLMVCSLRPVASATGNWTVGIFELGCSGLQQQTQRLALLTRVLAAAGECYDVSWPAAHLH